MKIPSTEYALDNLTLVPKFKVKVYPEPRGKATRDKIRDKVNNILC